MGTSGRDSSRTTVPVATVTAAQQGDVRALDDLVAFALPLVYNIVGHALRGSLEADDLVQETMLRVVRGLPGLRDPAAFRSWMVAVAVRQVRWHRSELASAPRSRSLEETEEAVDPQADFVDLCILRLGLTGQRREVAEATRWLDPDDRELLALWWLEAAGNLDRSELAAALDLPSAHAAVRVQRMKQQLDISRAVVRALGRTPRCAELALLTEGWDGVPGPLWRKRLARHLRGCSACENCARDLLPLNGLLAGMALLPVPAAHQPPPLAARHPRHGRTAAEGTRSGRRSPRGPGRTGLGRPRLRTVLGASLAVTVAVAAGVVSLTGRHAAAPTAQALPIAPAPVASPTASPSPSPQRTRRPSPAATTPAPAPSARAAAPLIVTGAKKGAATWSFDGVGSALSASGASWYYTWGPDHPGIQSPAGVQFVPMVWGAAAVTNGALATAREQGSTVLLGFNEPDLASQANMTPDQALDLWPKLMATGLTLGSPAVAANGATPGGWLDRFMSGARSRGYRVNFITLHWYGGDFDTADAVGQLRGYLQAVHARYGLPIWLTEYALTDFAGSTPQYPDPQQQAAFVTASTRMLQSLPYLQRYAWFALPATAPGATGLFLPGGAPNSVGQAYAAAGR